MENPTFQINLITALAGLGTAFLVGGGFTAVALLAAIRYINKDVSTQNAIESLALSLPPDTLLQVRDIIKLVQEGSALADKLTDGQPNEVN